MIRKIFISMLAVAMVITFAGCNGNDEGQETEDGGQNEGLSGILEIAGSTSVAPLAQDLADAFMTINENVTVNVQGLGSSAGVRAPVDGAAPIGMSSRNLNQEEKDWGVAEYVVALDGIALVAHPDNTDVDGITLEQAQKIFKGEITNWSEVGGSDRGITVVSREEGSGTRGAFEEILDFTGMLRDDALIGDGNGAVKANVMNNPDSIGYLSLGYIDETVKVLEVDGYKGTVENIQAGNYAVQRPFILITMGEEDELTRAFIEFALSAEGQNIVSGNYIPVS